MANQAPAQKLNTRQSHRIIKYVLVDCKNLISIIEGM